MHLTVTESQPSFLPLSGDEIAILKSLGRGLASTQAWWRETGSDSQASVVGIEHVDANQCRVTFRDVIGVVRLGEHQINVEPKIPPKHFLYLASHSELVPRIASAPIMVDDGTSFVELLARWCVEAAEQLLGRGLRCDYEAYIDESTSVRGALQVRETVLQTLTGRAVAVCEFDELTDDAPLNRVVRAACERLARMASISEGTRGRARRVAFRMDGVGPFRFADLRVTVDRLSVSYSRVIPLALLVLSGCGISSSAGRKVGSTFLVRTPELIENGLRTVLATGLPNLDITKRRLMLGNTGLSANPDLVFGDNLAVGDVKYRYLAQDWNRPDLNQVVAFATAFEARHCGLFGFVPSEGALRPRPVPMGPIRAASFGWVASPAVEPARSAALLCASVATWLAAHTTPIAGASHGMDAPR